MAYDKTCYLATHSPSTSRTSSGTSAFSPRSACLSPAWQGDPDDPTTGVDRRRHATGLDKSFEGPEGRIGHLGIFAEDLEAALEEAYKWGVVEMAQGHNWFRLARRSGDRDDAGPQGLRHAG